MARSLVTGTSTNGGTVTVYWAGTSTKPTIYVSATGAAKSNPITAGVDGSYAFWVDDGHYKITNGAVVSGVAADLTDVRVSSTPEVGPSAKNTSVLPFLGSTSTTQEALNEAIIGGTLSQSAGTFTGTITDTQNGIGETSTDGLVLANNTAAAASAQQWSPRIRFRGYGWETSGADTSMSTDWIIESQPTQSVLTEPTGKLVVSYQFNGTGYGVYFTIDTVNGFSFQGNLNMSEAGNVVLGTTSGTMIGTATTQKLGFHAATPVIQRASAAQASVVTTATTQTTPYGFATQAQGDAIVTLVNEIRAALVEKGLIKGSA